MAVVFDTKEEQRGRDTSPVHRTELGGGAVSIADDGAGTLGEGFAPREGSRDYYAPVEDTSDMIWYILRTKRRGEMKLERTWTTPKTSTSRNRRVRVDAVVLRSNSTLDGQHLSHRIVE